MVSGLYKWEKHFCGPAINYVEINFMRQIKEKKNGNIEEVIPLNAIRKLMLLG